MAWMVGVDVGGTFTDFFAHDPSSGSYLVFKVSSTPSHPERAILHGLELGTDLKEDFGIDTVSFLGHGTTVGTNALLERKGSRVAMMVTEGFKDVLEIGRQARSHLYDLQQEKVRPLVDRQSVIEVRERTRADGIIDIELAPDELRRIADTLRDLDPDSVAICFVNSYSNPEHELELERFVTAILPDVPTTASAKLVGELREVERFTTATANAFIMPKLREYFSSLLDGVAKHHGLGNHVFIMQSDGGLGTIPASMEAPIRLSLSGPAAGVIAATDLGMQSGVKDIITLDMGGTSTDVALVRNGEIDIVHEVDVAGHKLRVAALNIHTIGAGGGSIGFGDDGLLKVGPASAGADPGPASYGQGGNDATVTDAHVVLGRIADNTTFGEDIRVSRDLAELALERLGRRLGLDAVEAAHGVIRVANANIARAVSKISVERGIDPRTFALVPYGGAGPLHACEVADLMGISVVIVPRFPGALSALGLVVGDRTRHFAKSEILDLVADNSDRCRSLLMRLIDAATEWLDAEGIEIDARRIDCAVDMRHKGQNFELSVPVEDPQAADIVGRLREAFLGLHDRLYGYSLPSDPLVAITFRVKAVGLRRVSVLTHVVGGEVEGAPNPVRVQRAFVEGVLQDVPTYTRASIAPSQVVGGPCVVEQGDSTTWIPDRWSGMCDRYGNLVLDRLRS